MVRSGSRYGRTGAGIGSAVRKSKKTFGSILAVLVAFTVVLLLVLTTTGVIGNGIGIFALMSNHPSGMCKCFGTHLPNLGFVEGSDAEQSYATSNGKEITNSQLMNFVNCASPHITAMETEFGNAKDKTSYVQSLLKQSMGTQCMYEGLKTNVTDSMGTLLMGGNALLEGLKGSASFQTTADSDWPNKTIDRNNYQVLKNLQGMMGMNSQLQPDLSGLSSATEAVEETPM